MDNGPISPEFESLDRELRRDLDGVTLTLIMEEAYADTSKAYEIDVARSGGH